MIKRKYFENYFLKYVYYKKMCAINKKQSMHPIFLLKILYCPIHRETVIKQPYQSWRQEAKQKDRSIIKKCHCVKNY